MVHYARDSDLQVPEVFAGSGHAAWVRQLVLVGQPASSLQGVGQLARLTELWLVESQLRDASAARECVLLEKLVLSTNRLDEVPNLVPLTRLHTLWLAGNRILSITNVCHLPALEDLNLADNLICSLGAGLTRCKRLAVLNLSGNPLSALKESRRLCGLQSLRSLTMADPVYGATPMARLCNYRSCLLLHLPQLRTLDGFSVEPEELSQLKDFYASGARHMSMLRRHAEARYLLAVRELGKEAAVQLQRLREQFFYLGQRQCEVHNQLFEELSKQMQARSRSRSSCHLQRLGSSLSCSEAATAAAAAEAAAAAVAKDPASGEIKAARKELVVALSRWTDDLNRKLDQHRADYEMSFAKLECELESAGNVALSMHDEGSRLANVCQDLLNRLSCDSQFDKWRIRRARVLRVAHVSSRGAEMAESWRPAEAKEEVVQAVEVHSDDGGAPSQGAPRSDAVPPRFQFRFRPSRRSSLSALGGAEAEAEQHELSEGSARPADEQGVEDALGHEDAAGAAASSESVELDDCESLFQLLCSPARELAYGPWPFRLLDFPALGAAEEPLVVSNCLTVADSQWLQRHPTGLGDFRRLAPLVRLARGTRLHRIRRQSARCPRGARGSCAAFRVLGPQPELLFLVEFQYEVAGPAGDPAASARWRDVRPPAAVKHPILDEALLARCVACSDWGRLTSVNLAGQCIKVLGELPILPCVLHLDLSYNHLASLGSLYAFPNLKSLNLSFNNFVTLVNMRDLPALESLNLSWNVIRHLLVVLRVLNKHAAELRCLQVCHNPVEDVLEAAHGRSLAARHLPKLAALDGEPVGATPVFLQPPPGVLGTAFLDRPTTSQPPARTRSPHGLQVQGGRVRSASGSRSPQRSRSSVADSNAAYPPLRGSAPDDLRLRWRADQAQTSELMPDRFTLSARGRGLTHVFDPGVPSVMTSSWTCSPAIGPWLGAVRWADLGDNVIGEAGLAQALAAMPHLVQLDASRNALEGLSMTCFQHCPNLQKLDLSRNYLRAFPLLSLGRLLKLQFLDLSCNQLQSLSGLEEMTSLRELYLSNNHIRTLNDLQPLRKLQQLAVLDLTGNEICDDPKFKNFVVFHMRGLKCVNGQEVVDGDLVAARETFGGCLDRDALLTQYTWKDASHLVELHLTNANLRQVDLPPQLLPHLEVLDLSHNGLGRLWGLHLLPRLALLDLGHNQVRCLSVTAEDDESGDAALFPALHTLFLDNNGLTSLAPLALHKLCQLRTLFLQHNNIGSLAGLGHVALCGLVLDCNQLDGASLQTAGKAGLLRSVHDLHLDGNIVCDLGFIEHTPSVARLFIAKNKIADAAELELLRMAPRLSELCLLGNPVCLKPRHFAAMRRLLPGLSLLDGHSMDPARYLCPTVLWAPWSGSDAPAKTLREE